jgi:ribosomal protein S18 acetylase RimI-like enzyme
VTRIRPAIASDVAAIVRVADDDYPAGGAGAGDVDDDPALVARGKMRVLLDNRAVVGTAVLAPPEDHLLLRTVAVAPSHRSGGHGRRLIAFAEEEPRRRALEEIRVFLNLTTANEIRLYRGLGSRYYWREGYVRVFLRERLA